MSRRIFKQKFIGGKSLPGTDTRKEFIKKLYWLMFLRVFVITFLLGITILVQVKQSQSYLTTFFIYLYFLVGSVYFLTILYALILKLFKNLTFFVYLQITLDTFLITFLIYSTGGKESVFPFMYILSIITASILLYRKGGMFIASLCSILYGGLLDLEFYGILHSVSAKAFEQRTSESADPFYSILINITAFYLVAFLSSLLSEQTRRSVNELQKKKVDFDQLEALNRNIVQSINSGLLTIDLEGRIIFFNRAAEEITGHSFSQMYHSKVEEVFPFLSDKDTLLQNSLDEGTPLYRPYRFESKFTGQDGSSLHLGFSTSSLKDSKGEERGRIMIFQDLTQFKEMEEHIKTVDRLAAVGRLAAGIAHEMRNPLASMSGSIQILKDEIVLDDRNRRLMNIALRETDRLNALITDFMLFAQPGLGKKEIIDITAVLGDTLESFLESPEWNERVHLIRDISHGIHVEADPNQLKQVFWNLFMNAIQAMPEGGDFRVQVKKIGCTDGKGLKSEDSLEIIVSDTGYGIPQENLDKIFDPFFTTRDRGTGMGLAIAYRIIESCHGKIMVHSEVDQGTSFSIYLPVVSP